MAGLPPIVVPGQMLVYDGEVQNTKDPKRKGRIDVLANERCPAGPLRRIPPFLPPGLTTPVRVGDMVTLLEFPGQRIYWFAKTDDADPPAWAEEEPRKAALQSHDGRLQVLLDPEAGVVRVGRYDADQKAAMAPPLIAVLDKIYDALDALFGHVHEPGTFTAPAGGGAIGGVSGGPKADPAAVPPQTLSYGTAKTDTDDGKFASDVVLIPKELPQE